VDLYYAQVHANWNLLRKINLSTSFEFEHGSELSFYSEVFDRYGPAVSLGRPITAKLYASAGYQFYWRGSDVAGRDYTVNLLTGRMEYRF